MDWYKLPAVALAKVLGYLPLRDQLRARRVCKYWQLVNDSSVPRRKLILFIKIHPKPVYWNHDQRAADLADGLMVNCPLLENKLLWHEFFWIYFRNIQRLMVVFPINYSCYPKRFIERIQASFSDLQHLQFTSIGNRAHFCPRRALQTEIRLENLRTLYSYAPDMPLNLNCPNLTELFTSCPLTIDGTNEQTKKCLQNLKLLRVYRLTYPPGFKFTNLQILHLHNLPISLVDFPMLKELHCLMHCELSDGVLFEELLQQKERLKREDLRIFFQGFDMKGRNFRDIFERHLGPVGQLFAGFNFNAKVLRLVKESRSNCNFSLDRKAVDLCDSTDDELALIREGELPECLFKSITDMYIRKLSKASPAFFEISHKFPYIHSISIRNELSQTLYDRLPDVLPHLASLTYTPTFFQHEQISFEFVARFKSLKFFSIYHRLISIDEFKLILQNCKILAKVSFSQRKSVEQNFVNLWIEPTGQSERRIFKLTWRRSRTGFIISDFARATFDHEELFSYLEASKWIQKEDFI